jgi:hypothetical protein
MSLAVDLMQAPSSKLGQSLLVPTSLLPGTNGLLPTKDQSCNTWLLVHPVGLVFNWSEPLADEIKPAVMVWTPLVCLGSRSRKMPGSVTSGLPISSTRLPPGLSRSPRRSHPGELSPF